MNVEVFTVGLLSTNCYVVSCEKTKEAILIDPGFDYLNETEQVSAYLANSNLKLKYIVNTHGHEDHIKGNALLQEKYKIPIYVHALDESYPNQRDYSIPNVFLNENTQITFGTKSLKIIHTPGHTPGSICLLGDKVVFTGDTLFAGSIGRTDFPGGSIEDMRASLQKLYDLPDYLLVYPGHGEATLLGKEKRSNPFLKNLKFF